MMDKPLITITFSLCLFVCGCRTTPPPPPPLAFLPGECLVSDELQFYKESPRQIRISLDISNYEHDQERFSDRCSYCLWPTGNAWQGIVDRAKVEERYEGLISGLMRRVDLYTTLAVFSSGGETVIADKPFMECEAGENLVELLGVSLPEDDRQWHSLEEELDVHSGKVFKCAFPVNGVLLTLPQDGIDQLKDGETIHFKVHIPVMVVRLLHYYDGENSSGDLPLEAHAVTGSFLYQKGSGFRY